MKFIIFVIDGGANTASPHEMQDIDAFNDRLRSNGHWIYAAGIGGPESATLLDYRASTSSVSSGSLFSAPEHYSGFWLIEANSAEEALELAKEGSHACNRKVELRPFL